MPDPGTTTQALVLNGVEEGEGGEEGRAEEAVDLFIKHGTKMS